VSSWDTGLPSEDQRHRGEQTVRGAVQDLYQLGQDAQDFVPSDARQAAEVAKQIRWISNLSGAAHSILSDSQETDPRRRSIVGFFYNYCTLTKFQQIQGLNFEQIALSINQNPALSDSPVTPQEVGAVYQELQEKAEALGRKLGQELSQATRGHGKSQKRKSSKKSYTEAGWRGKSTRIARRVIHTANGANMIAEFVGGRNAALDALSLNKKLNANKNFVWLRKGKTKSARALRALITIAQTAGIYYLNRVIFNTLDEKADKRDSASGAKGDFHADEWPSFQHGNPSGTDTLDSAAHPRVTAV